MQAVFVDFDGTLVDTLPVLKQSYSEFLNHFARTGSDAEFNELNGPRLEQIVQILKAKYCLEFSVNQLLETYLEILEREYSHSIDAFPGAENFLIGLSKVASLVVLVTSSPGSFVAPFIKKVGWNQYLAHIVTGDMVKRSKPDPEIYLRALAVSGKTAANSIAIEDSINGVSSASKAGLRVLAVVPEKTGSQDFIVAGATAIVCNLGEAYDWIKDQAQLPGTGT